jgi:uncharacterized protein (DUF1330 family)
MSDTSVNLVVTGTPNPEAANEMKQYLGAAGPILASHGGELIYRGKIAKAVTGNVTFALILIMKFESEATLEAALESEAYKEIVPLREKGFKHMDFVVSHSM